MIDEVMKTYSTQLEAIQVLILLITALIHIVFAGAVARDSGELVKAGERPLLVSGIFWAFATLTGGVFVAAVYWILHHSKLTRS